MDTNGKRVWAKRPFVYNGQSLDRGQIFRLVGARNDRKLIDLNYVGEVSDTAETYQCALDGAEFVDLATRHAHGQRLEEEQRRRAAGRPLTPAEEDAREARQEQMLAEVAPVGRGVGKSK